MPKTIMLRIVFAILVSLFALSSVMPAYASAPDAAAAASGKRIIVNLNQQRLYAYNGNTLVASMAVTARGPRRGSFKVQNRLVQVNSIVRGWRLPYWMGIYYVGSIQNGIHGPESLSNGRVAYTSLGCVVILSKANAAWLFKWAPVGTPVLIR
jgi:lipoprotein-anchoring transpeptidase ErfK/SrfK